MSRQDKLVEERNRLLGKYRLDRVRLLEIDTQLDELELAEYKDPISESELNKIVNDAEIRYLGKQAPKP